MTRNAHLSPPKPPVFVVTALRAVQTGSNPDTPHQNGRMMIAAMMCRRWSGQARADCILFVCGWRRGNSGLFGASELPHLESVGGLEEC